MQGCCCTSSVHTTASNLSLEDEERGDGATESVHVGCEMNGKAVRALLWTTRTGEQESKMSVLTLKLPEKMRGESCDPQLVAAGSQTSLCLYSSCLPWKVHSVWHFRANVKQQGL